MVQPARKRRGEDGRGNGVTPPREKTLIQKWAVLSDGFVVAQVLVQPDPEGDANKFYPSAVNFPLSYNVVPYMLGVDVFETEREAYKDGAQRIATRIQTLTALRSRFLSKAGEA